MQLDRIQMFLCDPGGGGGEAEEMHGPARVWDVFTHVRSRRDQTHCNLEMCHSERGECVRECVCVYFFFSFLLSFLHAFGRRRTGAVTREPRNHKGKHKKNSFPLAAFTGDRACSLSLRWLRPPALCKCDVVESRLHVLALSRPNGAQSVPPSRLQWGRRPLPWLRWIVGISCL